MVVSSITSLGQRVGFSLSASGAGPFPCDIVANEGAIATHHDTKVTLATHDDTKVMLATHDDTKVTLASHDDIKATVVTHDDTKVIIFTHEAHFTQLSHDDTRGTNYL